jgi:imidazole glycerol phosphate synthase glutamine amidotransferase subunit
MMKMGVISCGGSNVTSVVNALSKVGHEPELLTAPDRKVDFLIMPGVGTYGNGTRRLAETCFSDFIRNHIKEGKPVVAICLGMQMLFESSEEDPSSPGLEIFGGHFTRLKDPSKQGLLSPPNIGYRYVEFRRQGVEGPLAEKLAYLNGHYYFMHSYALKETPASIDIVGLSNFNEEIFIPFLLHENLCGIQFHPERSGPRGLKLLAQTIDFLK